jgi:hypothetical protein
MIGTRARPVGATKDGIEVRREEEVEGPAAGGVDGLAVVLVDCVEVWALFAVDEDGNERGVKEGCDRGVRKGVLCCEVADWCPGQVWLAGSGVGGVEEGKEGLTVVCLEADMHEYRLVLGRGSGERVCVKHLPCYRSIGVSSHVWAVALAGTVLELWKRGTPGTGRAVLGLLLRLPLF